MKTYKLAKLEKGNTELKKQLAAVREKLIEVLDEYKITWTNIYDVVFPKSSEDIALEVLGDDNEK